MYREWLKMARTKQRLTQRELGKKVNVSPATINHYESGKRNPNVKIACRIADVLNVDLLEFVKFESDTYEM